MTEDRLSQEKRDEPEYPKPWISSQVAHPWVPHPLNEVRRLPSSRTFDYRWYWTLRSCSGKGRKLEKPLPAEGIMLNPRGECSAKVLGGTGENQQTSGISRSETRCGLTGLFRQAITRVHIRLDTRASEGSQA